MTFGQVKSFYESKENSPCEITTYLIKGGFHQRYGTGYLSNVKSGDIPSQWQHIMSYCLEKEENKAYPFTPCGELLFWMAEISNAVSPQDLKKLAEKIVENEPKKNRRIRNSEIKELCWQKIKLKIDSSQ